jgi:hypothetical protein
MVRSGSPICILAPSTFPPVVLNKRLAKVRIGEVLQPHIGDPADKEGRNQALLASLQISSSLKSPFSSAFQRRWASRNSR